MRVKISCDNGANIHSKRSDVVTLKELGFTEVEWNALNDDQKIAVALQYVNDGGWIEINYEEVS